MPYQLPQFPLTINVWRNATGVINPPDVVTQGNLTPGKRTFESFVVGVFGVIPRPLVYVLFPPLTDVRPTTGGFAQGDILECPAGSGRYYGVLWVEDVGKGFANEHRMAAVMPGYNGVGALTPPWPLPIP
jgi:hypothetical protein